MSSEEVEEREKTERETRNTKSNRERKEIQIEGTSVCVCVLQSELDGVKDRERDKRAPERKRERLFLSLS